jgi:hypothetical protein
MTQVAGPAVHDMEAAYTPALCMWGLGLPAVGCEVPQHPGSALGR